MKQDHNMLTDVGRRVSSTSRFILRLQLILVGVAKFGEIGEIVLVMILLSLREGWSP